MDPQKAILQAGTVVEHVRLGLCEFPRILLESWLWIACSPMVHLIISFLTAFAIGTLECVPINRGRPKFEITSISGDLHLQCIKVSGIPYPLGVTFEQGKLIT
ncbi:hypothetical protein P5673_022825, partial [Acropora cervicornis]